MIVNFAVEHNHRFAIFRKNGLIAGGEVNNLQTGCSERAGPRSIDSLLIWSAMEKGIRRTLDSFMLRSPGFCCESNDAAQAILPLSKLHGTCRVSAAEARSQQGKATSMILLKILQFDATDQKRVAFPDCNEVVVQNEMLPMNGSHEGG